MIILVIGHKGLLGSEVVREYENRFEVFGRDIDEMDITSIENCKRIIGQIGPDIIINCAAYTDVDRAESQVDLAYAVNERGPGNLARLARQNGILLLHFSSDYVFNGRKTTPYTEEEKPDPLSVYGKTKLAGERRIMEQTDNAVIIRTSWLYGGRGASFPRTIVRLAQEKQALDVVDDQRGSPTYAPDLAAFLGPFFDSSFRGIIHLTNSDEATWFDFARQILKEKGLSHVEVRAVTTKMFPRPAPRPSCSVLDTSLFRKITGLKMRSWKEALHSFVESGLL